MRVSTRSRRGVTLVELCVVIALVAILSTMVVSFSVLTSRRSRAAEARLSAMQEIAKIEVVVDAWFGRQEEQANKVTAADGALTRGGDELWFDAESKTLLGEVSGERVYSLPVEYVTGVTFSQSGEVYFCKVTYELPTGGESITFCVNPRVGEAKPSQLSPLS